MLELLIAFFFSLIVTLLIVKFNYLHDHLTADSNLTGPQNFHKVPVPRIGGVSIVVGLCAAILLSSKNLPDASIPLIFLLCVIPTFAIGLFEDLTKKISANIRLFLTAISAALITYLLQMQILRLDIPVLDLLFTVPFVGIFFTIFAMTGLANAYNIIDGFHGISSMIGIITLLFITYISFKVADPTIIYLCLTMIGAICGFFIWNYPRGLIFLGDGGAYLIGFWISSITILLINRHHEISPWFGLVINAYPIMEVGFSIYRRVVHQGNNPAKPDGMHLHTLIYRRIVKNRARVKDAPSLNSKVAPLLWILSMMGAIPAVIWYHSTSALVCVSIFFTALYIWLYVIIIKFRTPKWLTVLLKLGY